MGKCDVDPAYVAKLRKEGQTDEYIAWMLGCEVKDLPPRENIEPEEKEENST